VRSPVGWVEATKPNTLVTHSQSHPQTQPYHLHPNPTNTIHLAHSDESWNTPNPWVPLPARGSPGCNEHNPYVEQNLVHPEFDAPKIVVAKSPAHPFTEKQITRLVGVAPINHDSGKHKGFDVSSAERQTDDFRGTRLGSLWLVHGNVGSHSP